MLDAPLISVIVPVYNVAPYLRRCVDSILNQTYKNLEIILVDDGSHDNSPLICDGYAEKDSRVKVFHKINGGLSDARNTGLEISSGEFLSFVDGDDVIHPDFINKLFNGIKETKKEIAICLFQFFSDYMSLVFKSNGVPIRVLSLRSLMEDYCSLTPEKSTPLISCCTKLYHRSLFENLRFPIGRIYEDAYVSYRLLDDAGEAALVPEPLYGYYMRSNSIMGQKEKHSSKDVFKPYQEAIRYFSNCNKEEIAQLFYPPLVMREIYRYWIAKVQNEDEIDAVYLLNLMREDCSTMCSCKNVAFKLKIGFSIIVRFPFLYTIYRKIAPGFIGGR